MPLPPAELSADDELSAAWLNQFVAFMVSNAITIDPASGLAGSRSANGWAIGYEGTPDSWIKLTYAVPASATTGAGSYSWIEQVEAAGGGWTNGVARGYAAQDPAIPSGTPPDPAWEAGKNATLTIPLVVDASRDKAVGRLTFRARVCPACP